MPPTAECYALRGVESAEVRVGCIDCTPPTPGVSLLVVVAGAGRRRLQGRPVLVTGAGVTRTPANVVLARSALLVAGPGWIAECRRTGHSECDEGRKKRQELPHLNLQ